MDLSEGLVEWTSSGRGLQLDSAVGLVGAVFGGLESSLLNV